MSDTISLDGHPGEYLFGGVACTFGSMCVPPYVRCLLAWGSRLQTMRGRELDAPNEAGVPKTVVSS